MGKIVSLATMASGRLSDSSYNLTGILWTTYIVSSCLSMGYAIVKPTKSGTMFDFDKPPSRGYWRNLVYPKP